MKLLRSIIFSFSLLLMMSNLVIANPSLDKVIHTYSDIALAGYEDSLTRAKKLKTTIDQFLKQPTEETLKAARKAWVDARVPYMQTEAYRFGNAIVDDWEGRVNAWPLDEGMIDYVASDYGSDSDENELYVANIIARKNFNLSGRSINANKITKALLIDTLHEAGGVEANVATGYHAIEFLLWGQDLNGSSPGAGERPATDYDLKACTGGNCDRRGQYLRLVTEILIDDLQWMIRQWQTRGAARTGLLASSREEALSVIFTGIGSLSYGELAGERMKLGLMLHDPEEEHDCFSDNTHNSHYYNALGIQNVYLGRYKRIDGSLVEGASVSDLVQQADEAINNQVRSALENTLKKMSALKVRAETIEAYDQMIAEGNVEGNKVVKQSIAALVAHTKEIERAIAILKLKPIEIESSDSLDRPERVGTEY